MNESRQYNSLLQVTNVTAQSAYPFQALLNMQYNYSATQNNGRITSSNDYVTGENVSYTYDAVNRLTGASAGSMWGETYSYDGFGNLTGKNVTQAPTLGLSYDANNQQVGLTYDANGNQSMDAQGATYYNWNGENRLAQAWQWGGLEASTWYSYDPWGRRVMKDVNLDPGDNGYMGGAWEFYFYGITGQKLATVSCGYFGGQANCYMRPYNVYFGGKLVMTTDMGAVVTDRLGSVRNSGGVSYSYFPYGEERTVTPDDTEKFGTYYSDGPGQDYAEQRYYNSGTGRFWNVDPGGAGTDPPDPTSWNRYSYVRGDPVNRGDFTGLCDVLLAGITMNPGGDGAFDQFGARMMTGFGYSGTNWLTGSVSVIAQAAGANAATQVAYQAIMAAAQDPGPINIFAFSGGAQAFAAALLLLPQDVAERLNNVTYLSPGSFGGQLPSGSGTTTVISGGSPIDVFVGGNLPYGANWVDSHCGHRASCIIEKNLQLLQSLSGTPCSNPQVLTRSIVAATPGGAGDGGGGGVAPPDYSDIQGYLDYLWLNSAGAGQGVQTKVTSSITYGQIIN